MNTKTKLLHKDFLLVVIGQIISLFGNAILRFALPLYILQESGSPALFGMVSALSFIPMIILSPIGGMIADRVNKQRIMVVLDFITACVIGAFMILSQSISIIPLIVVTLMILYGIQGAYSPAVQASMPLLHTESNLMSANAIVNLVQSLSGLLGPVIGGILFGRYGLWPILVVGTICFLFSAILELFIRIPHIHKPSSKNMFSMAKADLSDGFKFIAIEFPTMLRVMILLFCINLFMSTMLIIGLPVMVTGTLGLGSELYGINQGALAVGGLLGGLLAGVLGRKLNIKDSWKLLLFCALLIIPLAFTLMLNLPKMLTFSFITLCAMLIMVCSTIFSIQMLSFGQTYTPNDLVGKVISLVMALNLLAQPIGQAIYGVLFEKFENTPGIVVLGAGIISVFISLYSKSTFKALEKEAA